MTCTPALGSSPLLFLEMGIPGLVFTNAQYLLFCLGEVGPILFYGTTKYIITGVYIVTIVQIVISVSPDQTFLDAK